MAIKKKNGCKNAKQPKMIQMTFASSKNELKTCPNCGFNFILYNTKNKNELHNRYHKEYLNGYELNPRKLEKLKEVGKVLDVDTITLNDKKDRRNITFLLVSYKDKFVRKVVSEMLQMINDRWLNTPTEENEHLDKILLIISQPLSIRSSTYIAGVTTTIPGPMTGFYMHAESSIIDQSRDALNLQLGISRIFVSQMYRRKGFALRMLQYLRKHAVYGVVLTHEEIGFSQPSGAGTLLIEKWMYPKTFIPVYHEL